MAWTVEVHSKSGGFVIRADPWNRREGLLGFVNWAVTLAHLERLVTRDHRWVIRIRRREHDPFGPTLYEQEVPRRADVQAVIQRLERSLHDGWTPERT